jgi:hypothetical protein
MVAYEELMTRLHAWDVEHRPFDVTTKLPHYEFLASDGGSLKPLKQIENIQQLQEYNLSDHAMQQMLGRLDFPVRFYDRLPVGLRYANVNWLVQNGAYDSDVMLRVQDDKKVRAMMSGRFEPFDHLELLELLQPFADGAVIRWEHKDDMVLHLSMSYPSRSTEIKVGDIVEAGVHISNSETGVRSVTIAAYVYRLRCTNGVIGTDRGSIHRFRHIGDSNRLQQAVQSAMADVWMEGQGIIAKFKLALTQKVEKPIDMIQSLCKERNLSQDEFKRVLDCWGAEPGDTKFEISQAFSRAAQGLEAEKSYEIQRIATDVL